MADLPTLLSFYVLVNAISSILTGGRHLLFDWVAYHPRLDHLSGHSSLRPAAQRDDAVRFSGSGHEWTAMSAAINNALLIAFTMGAMLEDTT
jgi:predicted Co/Zn/Cd cation transporter (cation efflux family)